MEQCVQRATEDADHRVHVADRVLFCATSFITNNLGWRCRAAHAGLQTGRGLAYQDASHLCAFTRIGTCQVCTVIKFLDTVKF